MKYLKNFNESKQDDVESKSNLISVGCIGTICQKYGIENYTINEDLSIDVIGDVYLSGQGLTKLPLKFRNITEHFFCSNNQLTTLEGAPRSIGGNFYCHDNKLVSLEGVPQSVGDLHCSNNQLVTLEGAPRSVSGNFYCYNNQLMSLEFAPSCRNIYCSNNPIYRWWDMVNDITKLDAFIDLGIDARDPDFMNQEKIDLLL